MTLINDFVTVIGGRKRIQRLWIMKAVFRYTGFFLVMMSCNGAMASNEAKNDHISNSYSSDAALVYRTNVYWGDTHLHTNLSFDAYNYGNKLLGPEEAYRFAKGEAVQANNGMTAKLRRPLDFLVIADHASNMGLMQGLTGNNSDLLSLPLGQQFASQLEGINKIVDSDRETSVQLSRKLAMDGFTEGRVLNNQNQQTVWKAVAMLADHHNIPGKFTAFVGYEWTQLFYVLHRVIIFKDGAEKAAQSIPFSQYDSSNPEALWSYLDAYESQTGGEVLAIPHNGNLSNGVMFALEDVNGKPLSADYAKARARWEPLFEVTQIKGDSETHPELSPTDEFSDYATVNYDVLHNNWGQEVKNKLKLTDYDSWVNKKIKNGDRTWNYLYGYARPALKLGLQQQFKLGINPFKFGMIGSTDSHTSLATGDEDNFFGKNSWVEPYPNRVKGSWNGTPHPDPGYLSAAWNMNAAGYAAIWAEENTRESLFAAMKRKEVYASTGPRMNVRFFGGWDYQTDDAFKPDLARIGYEKGVPMGGDLTHGPDNKAPTFLIRAVKDPDGANLDRVQVIKGWHDKNGKLHEKIYNVSLSDGRKINRRGKVKPVGNSVNIPDASYTNNIGDPELAVVWADPDFNKDELAFYYVRVLEIPTPRWTAYDAKFFGLTDIPKEVSMITQERAYTSPIWYTPSGFSQR